MLLTENDRRSYLLGLRIAGDFGAAIAVPVVVFVLAGKWLQTRFGFAPYGIISGFVLSATVSAIIIRRRVAWYACEYRAIKTPEKNIKCKREE